MEKLITPVGCGYDYFANPTSFLSRLKGRPIVNIENKVAVNKEMETDVIAETKKSVRDFFTSFEIQEEIQGQYKLFSAGAAGGFKTGSHVNSQYAYTRIVAIHKRARHTFVGNLYDSLNEVFDSEINGTFRNREMTPYNLHVKYGTHVITDAVMGGMLEFLFVTQRTQNESYDSVNAKVKAAYGALVSGSVNTQYDQAVSDIMSRSSLTIKTIGGKSLAMTNLTEFQKNYAEWAESLDDPQYQEFCGFHEGSFASSCIPISSLATSLTREKALQEEFEKEHEETKDIVGPELQSNLAETKCQKYNNDMVTALTQYSVNRAMKSYIKSGFKLGKNKYPKIAAYILIKSVGRGRKRTKVPFYLYADTDVEKELPKGFPEKLRCKDLYDQIQELGLDLVPSDPDKQTEEDIAMLETAYNEYYVRHVVFGEFGFPSFFTKDDIVDFKPIVLTTDGKGGAQFTHCFKEFKIMELFEEEGEVYTNIFDQSDDKIARQFKYDISFDMTEGSKIDSLEDEEEKQSILQHFKFIDGDKKLSDYTSDELNHIYQKIDNMYSMSQLYLDFNTLSTVEEPNIEGMSLDSAGAILKIIPELLKRNLQQKVVLGRTFTENRDKDDKYIVLPIEYAFSVTPGPKSDNDLNTLNYVINLGGDCNDNRLRPQDYDWKWVEEGRKHLQSGVSVINRSTIFGMVLNQFEQKVLPDLCLDAKARIEGKKVIGALEWIAELNETKQVRPYFAFNNDRHYVLQKRSDNSEEKQVGISGFGWNSFSEQKTKYIYIPPFLAASCSMKLSYNLGITATWGSKMVDKEELPAIIFEVHVKCWADVVWNNGHGDGNVYDSIITCSLVLDVDDRGNITLIPYVEEKDLGGRLEGNAWSQFCTFGDIDKVYERIENACKKAVEKAVDDFTDSFKDAFHIGSGWVLPGHGTFTFANERFSKYGDFAIDVNYYDVD